MMTMGIADDGDECGSESLIIGDSRFLANCHSFLERSHAVPFIFWKKSRKLAEKGLNLFESSADKLPNCLFCGVMGIASQEHHHPSLHWRIDGFEIDSKTNGAGRKIVYKMYISCKTLRVAASIRVPAGFESKAGSRIVYIFWPPPPLSYLSR